MSLRPTNRRLTLATAAALLLLPATPGLAKAPRGAGDEPRNIPGLPTAICHQYCDIANAQRAANQRIRQ